MLDMTSLAGVDLNIARLPRHGRVISSDITWLWRGDRVVSGFILAYKNRNKYNINIINDRTIQ